MEILINGHPIEFSLENEKTIAEVVNSISRWARERDLIFTQFRVDGRDYGVENPPDVPVEQAGNVNCVIQSRAELVVNSINEASAYCEKLVHFMKSAGDDAVIPEDRIDEMKTGIDWLFEVSTSIFSLLEIDPGTMKFRDGKVSDLFRDIGEFRIALAESTAAMPAPLMGLNADLFVHFRDVMRMILLSENMRRTAINSTDSPDTVLLMLNGIILEIPSRIQNIEQAAVDYQTGKDVEASEQLEIFIDFVYRYLRVCHQVKPVFGVDTERIIHDGVSLPDRNLEINGLLNQMLSALENNDIISLSDILEYEMKPALETLSGYCDSIFRQVQLEK